MFFEEEVLADILTCPKCEKKYDDPRLLPCGETLCNKCIDIKTDDKNNKGYECEFCDFFHQLFAPMQAFPVNKRIQKLIDQENLKISHSHLISEFKSVLNTLKEYSAELGCEKTNSLKTIKNFCTHTRNEIVTTSKILIINIQKQTDELIGKINRFEINCLQNNEKINHINLSHILTEADNFETKWADYINFQIVKETDIRQALEKAHELSTLIAKNSNMFKKSLFDDQLVFFRPTNTQEASLGNLIYENISECYLKFDKFKRINLKNSLNLIEPIYYECVYVHNFADGSFLFAYPTGPFNIKLSIVKQDQVVRGYELVQPINQFKKAIFKERIFLFFSYCQKLRCLDKDFHTQSEGNVGSEVLSMAATNMYLFCLMQDNMILKFSHKLSLLQKIRINEENLDGLAQYMNKYDRLRSFRDTIFLSKSNGMLSINSVNLKEFKKLPIKENKFVFFNDKIVALNSELNHVIFYDIHGMVIQKQIIENMFSKNLILIESEDFDRISFFDLSQFVLYSYGC